MSFRIALILIVLAGAVRANDLDLPVMPPERAPVTSTTVTLRGPRGLLDPFRGIVPLPPPEESEEKPPTFYGTEVRSSNKTLVFVIDVSGSMSLDERAFTDEEGGVSIGHRLDRAKAELKRAIATLPSDFEFTVIAYDCSLREWSRYVEHATPSNKKSAIAWVALLLPGGGTGTGGAVARALSIEEVRLVVLLTDGDPNCDLGGFTSHPAREQHRRVIRQANQHGASVNVFGIGATGALRQFCLDVAADNGGSYTDVR